MEGVDARGEGGARETRAALHAASRGLKRRFVSVDAWQHYVQLAVKDKERYEQERLDNPVVEEEHDDVETAKESHACVYPLGG